jgi:hypothetical protein
MKLEDLLVEDETKDQPGASVASLLDHHRRHPQPSLQQQVSQTRIYNPIILIWNPNNDIWKPKLYHIIGFVAAIKSE